MALQEALAAAAAAAGRPRPTPRSFASVAAVLSHVKVHAPSAEDLAGEGVRQVADLASLSKDELKQLGFNFMDAKKVYELLQGAAKV